MEPLIDFADLVTGLQRLPEREKIILVALINGHGRTEKGNVAKIERMVAQAAIAVARDQGRCGQIPAQKLNVAPRMQRDLAPCTRTHLRAIG